MYIVLRYEVIHIVIFIAILSTSTCTSYKYKNVYPQFWYIKSN